MHFHAAGLDLACDRSGDAAEFYLVIVCQLRTVISDLRTLCRTLHLFIRLGGNVSAGIQHLHTLQIGLCIL